MRILVNAASAHMGGSVTYLQNILRWLPKVMPSGQFIVFVPEATKNGLDIPSVKQVELNTYPYKTTQGLRRLYFDQIRLSRIAWRKEVDVLFSTTGFGTVWRPCAEVLLIRNMAYFDPQFHAKYRMLGRNLYKNTLRRWHSLLSIKRTNTVIFPTDAMRDMVAEYIDLSAKRTKAIHYGFDRDRFFAEGNDEPEIVGQMREWNANGERILLSVSTYAVHKNFETLIEALPKVRNAGCRFRLITTTSRDRTSDTREYDALQHRAKELGVDDLWVESGYIDYGQLQHLYRLADAYVFPSFTESFGHSLVEAMASGAPVIAASTQVNREVCGEAGAFFAPFDPDDCARTIKRVLTSDAKRNELAQSSLARADHFSWKGYARQLVSLFRETANLDRKTESS